MVYFFVCDVTVQAYLNRICSYLSFFFFLDTNSFYFSTIYYFHVSLFNTLT